MDLVLSLLPFVGKFSLLLFEVLFYVDFVDYLFQLVINNLIKILNNSISFRHQFLTDLPLVILNIILYSVTYLSSSKTVTSCIARCEGSIG